MDIEQFKQIFAIAYLASRFAQMRDTDRREGESVHEQMNRMSEISWIHFCEIWPVKPYRGEDNPPIEGP
jgi:hypothetical protein